MKKKKKKYIYIYKKNYKNNKYIKYILNNNNKK